MGYKVKYTPRALKQLQKLDKQTSGLIIAWIEKNLVDCEYPRQYGKSLKGSHSGQWRYRVGDYRLIVEIEDDEIIILILNVGHRRDIYD